jgi:hypothetical protein
MIQNKTRTPDESLNETQSDEQHVDRMLQQLGIPDEDMPRITQKVASLRANIEAEIRRYRERSQRP